MGEGKKAPGFEFAGVGTIILDAETGTVVTANLDMEEIFGFARGELRRRKWADLLPPEEAARWLGYQRLILAHPEQAPRPCELRLPDGTGAMRQVSAVADRIPGTRFLVASLLDMTGLKRIQAVWHHQEDNFRTLLENALDLITIMSGDGAITYQSPSSARALGYPPEEWIGRSFFSFLHPEDAPLIRSLFVPPGFPTGRSFEFRLRHHDGSWRIMEGIGKSVFGKGEGTEAILNSRDVTERKGAEEALRRSEERFRQLYDEAPVGYHELDREGRIVRVNRTELEMLGYTEAEMIGRPLWEFMEEGRETIRDLIDNSIPPGRAFERTYRKKDGSTMPALVEDRLIGGDRGKITGILSTIHDITERKRVEKEMAELAEQLRLSQKMEAIGLLAGGIAHDFNNILTVIRGFSELSLQRLGPDDALIPNVEEIRRATERAADLVQQLLAFSRRQVLDMRILDLNSILRDLEKMLRRIIGEDIELIADLAPDLGRVKSDYGQIEQMILNLAVNARDAMPQGGKLILETRNILLDEVYARRHIAVKAGRYVMLAVSDTGCGMTREVQERVFEPFFTTKEKGKGTGLGLSTVYGLVKQSGGNIWVYSEPGRGTAFKIYLPAVEGEVSPICRPEESGPLPTGEETILLVEDEDSVRDLVVQVLGEMGFRVFSAPNGAEALQLARDYEGEIDLLLTDMVMPLMSGKELAEQLKTFRPRLKILFTSGYSEFAVSHQGRLDPGTAFLAKPFTIAGLGRRVRELLDS